MSQALIIDMDEYKELIPGYAPSNAFKVQTQSAHIANAEFKKAIRSGKFSRVILMSGGSASGKTEFVRAQLFDEDAIIFDSTLSKKEGATIKIEKSLKHNLEVEIVSILPDSLERAWIAFINRDRKIPHKVFSETHIGSRRTLLEVHSLYNNVKIKLIKSYYTNDKLQYNELQFNSINTFKQYLTEIQLTPQDFENYYEGSTNQIKKT